MSCASSHTWSRDSGEGPSSLCLNDLELSERARKERCLRTSGGPPCSSPSTIVCACGVRQLCNCERLGRQDRFGGGRCSAISVHKVLHAFPVPSCLPCTMHQKPRR
eukprot:1161105-Pelagomonas_calceolata.AAC.9